MRSPLPCLLLLIAACAPVGPDYRRPEVALPARYAQGTTGQLGEVAARQWWTRYQDRALNDLVGRGLRQNLSIATALERIRAAEASLRASGGAPRQARATADRCRRVWRWICSAGCDVARNPPPPIWKRRGRTRAPSGWPISRRWSAPISTRATIRSDGADPPEHRAARGDAEPDPCQGAGRRHRRYRRGRGGSAARAVPWRIGHGQRSHRLELRPRAHAAGAVAATAAGQSRPRDFARPSGRAGLAGRDPLGGRGCAGVAQPLASARPGLAGSVRNLAIEWAVVQVALGAGAYAGQP